MKKTLVTASLAFLSIVLPLSAKAEAYSKMYVFGDSLVEPGNLYKVTTDLQLLEASLGVDIPIIPAVPPYEVNGRFSNGLIWIDYLAQDLGVNFTPSTQLSVLSPQTPIPSSLAFINGFPTNSPFFLGATANVGVNFAYAGAQTGFVTDNPLGAFIPGILTQINYLANDLGAQSLDSDALYIIWAGANDYLSVPNANPTVTVGNLGLAINSLYNLGARNFLIPNLPDLGKTPGANTPTAPVPPTLLTQNSLRHNSLLETTLDNLDLSLADSNFISVDIYSLLEDLSSNPTKFGLTNIQEPCFNELTLTICSNPDEYIFWDSLHPTTFIHNIIGELALNSIKSSTTKVPEPSNAIALALSLIVIFSRLRVGSNFN